ncbi:MAG TPA: integrase [Ktedonobacteraceae bacterium]|jgi:integrase
MAIGQSRRAAKQAARAAGVPAWAFSTGKIHSYKTREVYQEQTLRFVRWVRQTFEILRLEDLDARAEELVSLYLRQEIATHKSPYTLQLERSALRLFFARRDLAIQVPLPLRTRAGITRSRGSLALDHSRHPASWQPLISFARACGLRRSELAGLRVADVFTTRQGQVQVLVHNGKGGRERLVPALPGHEQDILAPVTNRQPHERIFVRIPVPLDVHALRRAYARALYLHYANIPNLPPVAGRLRPTDYDRAAVQRVSWALGHNRLSVALTSYLR